MLTSKQLASIDANRDSRVCSDFMIHDNLILSGVGVIPFADMD